MFTRLHTEPKLVRDVGRSLVGRRERVGPQPNTWRLTWKHARAPGCTFATGVEWSSMLRKSVRSTKPVAKRCSIARGVENISKQEPGQSGTYVQNSIPNCKSKYKAECSTWENFVWKVLIRSSNPPLTTIFVKITWYNIGHEVDLTITRCLVCDGDVRRKDGWY